MKGQMAALLCALLLLLTACASAQQESEAQGYELYYLADLSLAGGEDAIAASRTRYVPQEGETTEDCARALVEQLLADPSDGTLRSPVPAGTSLQLLKISGRRARIDLSAQYARLSGVDLTLADYCFTLTLTQLEDVNAVSITAGGRELPYRTTHVLLAADTLLSSRDSAPRPITVSLYYLEKASGALRAEQQTLALYEGQTRVSAVLEALSGEPEDDTLVSIVPEGLAVLSSRIEEGTCYVNLSGAELPEEEAARQQLLDAVELSLASISGVETVQLLIEGESAPRAPNVQAE